MNYVIKVPLSTMNYVIKVPLSTMNYVIKDTVVNYELCY